MQINGLNNISKIFDSLNLDFNKLENTILLLKGDLGAGKTTFTREILKKIGIKENITSPTFSIMNQYKIRKLNINHIDAYRLKKNCEEEDMLNEQLINSFSIVEWYENINLDLNNLKIIHIEFKYIDENIREVTLW